MRVIFARASCRYSGRIDAELSLGDVAIVLREPSRGGDGSVLVLDPTKGMLPRNWMPGGSVITTRPGGYLVEHAAKGELLEIFVDRVYSEQSMEPEVLGELKKLGAEREFSDLLAENLHLFETPQTGKLTLVGREWRTPAGPVDLLAQCEDGNPLAIEAKRAKITLADAYQLTRYTDSLVKMPEWENCDVRGVLVAPTLANSAKEIIQERPDIRFVRASYKALKG